MTGSQGGGAGPRWIPHPAFEDFLGGAPGAQPRGAAPEQVAAHGAQAVGALCRLLDLPTLRATAPDIAHATLMASHQDLVNFAYLLGGQVRFAIGDGDVFVQDSLLSGPRRAHEPATELHTRMRAAGLSAITIDSNATEQDLAALADCLNDTPAGAALPPRLRNVDLEPTGDLPATEGAGFDPGIPMPTRRLYAFAMTTTREHFDRLGRGERPSPVALKRLCTHLVDGVLQNTTGLHALFAVARWEQNLGGRALCTAVVALLIARQITDDRIGLAQIALAALTAEQGHVCVAAGQGRLSTSPLLPAANARVPAVTAACGIATGGVNASNALRTVAIYEATALERRDRLAPMYGGGTRATILAQLLMTARAFSRAACAQSPTTQVRALRAVLASPVVDPTLGRLLISAVGPLPAGTLVDLSTEERAVVVGPSATPQAFDRPRVRPLRGASGPPDTSAAMDLGAAPQGSIESAAIVQVLDEPELERAARVWLL